MYAFTPQIVKGGCTQGALLLREQKKSLLDCPCIPYSSGTGRRGFRFGNGLGKGIPPFRIRASFMKS